MRSPRSLRVPGARRRMVIGEVIGLLLFPDKVEFDEDGGIPSRPARLSLNWSGSSVMAVENQTVRDSKKGKEKTPQNGMERKRWEGMGQLSCNKSEPRQSNPQTSLLSPTRA